MEKGNDTCVRNQQNYYFIFRSGSFGDMIRVWVGQRLQKKEKRGACGFS